MLSTTPSGPRRRRRPSPPTAREYRAAGAPPAAGGSFAATWLPFCCHQPCLARLSCCGKELQLPWPALGLCTPRAAAPLGDLPAHSLLCPGQGRSFQPCGLVEQKHPLPALRPRRCQARPWRPVTPSSNRAPASSSPVTPLPLAVPPPVPTSLPSLPGVPAPALPSAAWAATPCRSAAPPACRLHPKPSRPVTRAGADASALFAGSCTRTGSTGPRST